MVKNMHYSIKESSNPRDLRNLYLTVDYKMGNPWANVENLLKSSL